MMIKKIKKEKVVEISDEEVLLKTSKIYKIAMNVAKVFFAVGVATALWIVGSSIGCVVSNTKMQDKALSNQEYLDFVEVESKKLKTSHENGEISLVEYNLQVQGLKVATKSDVKRFLESASIEAEQEIKPLVDNSDLSDKLFKGSIPLAGATCALATAELALARKYKKESEKAKRIIAKGVKLSLSKITNHSEGRDLEVES